MNKKVFIINLLSVIIIILILETLVNLFNLSGLKGIDSGLLKKDIDEIHQFSPNSSGKIFGKKIFIDKYGLRVPSNKFKYNLNNDSIYFIGDSTAFGNGIEEDKTFVGLLRKNFPDLNFYNNSVPGYNIIHHQKNLKKIDKFDNIKKVFYIMTLNDIYAGPSIQTIKNVKNTEVRREAMGIENINLIKKINAFLRSKSYLYMYAKGKIYDPSKRYFLSILSYYETGDLKQINSFADILNKKMSDKNIDLTIVLLPYEYQTRTCEDKNLLPQYKILKIFQNLKINLIDYTKKFCESEYPKNLFYKFDPMHLSEKGHYLVFELIKNEI